jgi:hypothetical protein
MKRLLVIAFALATSTLAFATDRPTDQEILKAAQDQGIANLATASGQPGDPSAWRITGVLIKSDADPKSTDPLAVYAQVEATTDLFLEARKTDGKTIVTPTFQTGAGISIPGKMLFQRVGFFTRSWEIKFAWNNALPPGTPLTTFENAISSQSDEGRALSMKVAADIKADLDRQVAESANRTAKFELDRAAAQQSMERVQQKDEADITAALAKFVGKWLPYTIVTPTEDPKNPKSEFRAVRIDEIGADGAVLTLLLGSDEQAKRAPVKATVGDGRLNFRDSDDCQVDVAPSRRENGDLFMLFGSRLCNVARQHLSIVLEERTPKQVSEFVMRMKNSPSPAPSKPALPLPNLKP